MENLKTLKQATEAMVLALRGQITANKKQGFVARLPKLQAELQEQRELLSALQERLQTP